MWPTDYGIHMNVNIHIHLINFDWWPHSAATLFSHGVFQVAPILTLVLTSKHVSVEGALGQLPLARSNDI